MSCEYYTLEWDGKKLRMEEGRDAPLALDAEGRPAAPWETHSCLGDDNKVWCEVFRAPGIPGGVFVLRDFDEALLAAEARTNMGFLQGLDHFSRLVSNARYAADIFEHSDDEGDDE